MKSYRLLFICVLFFSIEEWAHAATINSVSTGNRDWNTTAAWVGGVRPAAGDVVIINTNMTIALSTSYSTPLLSTVTVVSGKTLTVTSNGTLNCSAIDINGGTLTLNTGNSGLVTGPITNSGTVNFNGTAATASSITNSGTVNFNGGLLTATSITNTSVISVGGSGTISLSGDFTDNGGYFDSSGGNISFTGTSQTVYNITGIATFSNLNVNSGTVSFTSDPGASMDVNSITVSSGASAVIGNGSHVNLSNLLTLNGTATFDADGPSGTGVFTLISTDQSTTGSIGKLITPSNFSGNVVIQRFIHTKPGGGGDYRYLSMPLTNGNLSFWRTAIGVTGDFSDKSTNADFSNVNDTGNSNASVFEWNPSTLAYVPLSAGGGTTTSKALSNDKAYVAYNFNDANAVAEYTGSISKGNVVVTISSTTSSYNLVPNPYPCSVNWDRVWADNTNSVNASIYWRTSSGAFASYLGLAVPPPDPNQATGGEIAIGQSFWVVSSGSGSTLTFSETHKTTSQGTFLREQTNSIINYIRLSLASATQKDHTVIRFHNDATDGRDGAFDAVKRYNGSFNSGVYSYINLSTFNSDSTKDFVINSVADLKGCTKIVGVRIADVKPGNYTFQFTELEKLALGYKIILTDNFLKTQKEVTNNMEYTFAVTANASSFGSKRFTIRFEQPIVIPVITVKGQSLVSSNGSGNQWYKDGQVILGATGSVFDVTSSGTYTVKNFNGGCEASAESITMSITSIPEIAETISNVYPNPTSGKVFIKLPQDKDASLTGIYLYDLKGSIIVDSNKTSTLLTQGEKTIDITNSRNGVYILNLVSGKEIKSIRLIKK